MKIAFPSQRTKCQETGNKFISEYFNPTVAFIGNTGRLSITCHPSHAMAVTQWGQLCYRS